VIEIVTDDMPFLVNSVSMELNRHGLTYHLIVHPIMHIRRNNRGRMLQILPLADAQAKTESLIHVEVDYQGSGKAKLDEIHDDLIGIIEDILA
jgi:glutamate dehydrogenase